ncbi:GHKL domain-containing protein [bacterium]|nr:GHKL domain-containing protein [bacterium]
MAKKSEKARVKVKPNVPTQRKVGFNTIFLTIISFFMLIISTFTGIIYYTIDASMKNLEYGSIKDSLMKISGFEDINNERRWQDIDSDINSKLSSSEQILYYIVVQKVSDNDDKMPTFKIVETSIKSDKVNSTDWCKFIINPYTKKLVGINLNFYKIFTNVKSDEDFVDDKDNPFFVYQKSIPLLVKDENDDMVFLGIQYNDQGQFKEFKESAMKGIFLLVAIMFALSLIGAFILAQSITQPLAIMTKTVSKIAKGDLSGRLEPTKYEELNHLVETYNMMANALQRLYSTLEAKVSDRTRELKSAYAELQNTQAMMVHSEKMKSLGELVAGIMHEINNPINFIYGNMTHLSNYSSDLISIIDEYEKYKDSLKPEEKESIEKYMEEVDYGFLKSDLPELIKSCKEGADRAKNIIQDLKSFSRMEEVAITDVDVPTEIDTTLNILHNKIKNKAQVHKEYMENVPKIEAFGGQLNQVFMNILDNAVGAIEKQGDIWIRINPDKTNKNLVIEIEDNGVGMDSETARKVFDPFFTTKPVGQGTGLGMSITHKIIKNHQGSINVESSKGTGTKFIITLPLNINRENLKTAALSEGENNG